ncbi:MAG: PBP1A family penicillin-binding protein [Acidobacteriota bacterium]|nr:PBP1A family penicillin-binding protein [Acidobacteriota bacterium]
MHRLTHGPSPPKDHEPHTISACPRPPPWNRILLGAGLMMLLLLAVAAGVFVHFYLRFSRIIDARLDGNVFGNPAVILAAPSEVHCGQRANARDMASYLRKAGYTEDQKVHRAGAFTLTDNGLEVHPGSQSFFRNGQMIEGPARLEFKADRLVSMTALDSMTALKAYWLEPVPITTLFGESRAKRRLIQYQELPKALVDAILATEDHRFYSHHGVDSLRMVAAAIADLRSDKRLQGGSTLTMQLARNLFLTPRRTIRRKLAEVFFAMILEHRLTKEQIFVLYANQVYLGQHDSFSIYGFGEAASVYFNKDLSAVTLPEAAFLAGLIRGPNLYLPYEHPQRAAERRNFVLGRMKAAGFINEGEFKQASVAPLMLTEQPVEARQQAYFVDFVKAQILAQFPEADLLSQGYRVYTTLDLDLQQAATEGASAGLIELDRQVKRVRDRRQKSPPDAALPQVALVALDPATGDVKALVGGRAYNGSQLNHALALRQPGSSFKPFVYAAALNSGVDGSLPLVTPATVLEDEPTTFEFSNRSYSPRDFGEDYQGSVTVRKALTFSLNVPAVHLAEMVGYGKVRNLALRAGFNNQLEPTPSLALGAYVATPLEVAGAYTIFADRGAYVAPRCIVAVTDADGGTVWGNPVRARRVLDSRVSYLMVSLLESVINNGTGAGVRARGFNLPAAGKTGTSHDGWFAGFTPNLLAVVWVGYDDDRDLNFTGAQSALPVWTEFMKRTTGLSVHNSPQPFNQPDGIETATIDNLTNLVALPDPALTHSEVFIVGTEPFAPVPGVPAGIALGPLIQRGLTLAGMVSPSPADEIVLTSDTHGRKVYINPGVLLPPAPSR